MMDSYTSSMCNASWGQNSYARVMVEVQSDRERKESMVIALPNLEDDGFTRETVTSIRVVPSKMFKVQNLWPFV